MIIQYHIISCHVISYYLYYFNLSVVTTILIINTIIKYYTIYYVSSSDKDDIVVRYYLKPWGNLANYEQKAFTTRKVAWWVFSSEGWQIILCMEDILHHLGWLKPYK